MNFRRLKAASPGGRRALNGVQTEGSFPDHAQRGCRVDCESVAYRFPLSGMAVWGAWVLAGAVGSVLPYVAITFGWLPGDGSWIAAVVGAAIVAFPQYIVLRLIGHSSLAGAMWIPVSVVAWLAADLAMSVSAERITNALLSVGAIQALTPGPFRFLTMVNGVESTTTAAVLGLGQGLLLARIFVARSAARLWFVGNLVAAVVMWIVIVIRLNGVSTTNQTVVDLLLPIAIDGALYAAVTGIALLAMSRRDGESAARRAGVLVH